MNPIEAIRFVLANSENGKSAEYRSNILTILELIAAKPDDTRWDADELEQLTFNIDVD